MRLKLIRIRSGLYETTDGRWQIEQPEHIGRWWQVYDYSRAGRPTNDLFFTLHDAREWLAAQYPARNGE